jgi:hypothetical protein
MTARYRRRADVTARSVERSVFLARPGRGPVYRLNETGSALWRLLEHPVPIAEAVAAFEAAFPRKPRASIERHLRGLVSVLVEDGLVEQVGA